MSFQAPPAIFGGFRVVKSFKISNFRLRRTLWDVCFCHQRQKWNFISFDLHGFGSLGFGSVPKKQRNIGDLKKVLCVPNYGSTNTLGSGIKSQVGLIWAIIMTGKLWSAWVCSPWRLDSWSYGTDVTYRGELSSSHLEWTTTRSQIQMVHERSPQIFDVSWYFMITRIYAFDFSAKQKSHNWYSVVTPKILAIQLFIHLIHTLT